MTSTAAGRRGTRAGAALALAVGALLALGGLAATAGTVAAAGSTTGATQQHAPFGFD